MEVKEKLVAFTDHIPDIMDSITTEEATKTSLVMPFFQILGYNIFDPSEFVPEYVADVGTKKGEKVDYAIIIDDEPLILIECKECHENLDNHSSQLFRYFGTTLSAKFAILTNGVEYRFFTDLENENRMDETPFLVIDLLDLKDRDYTELSKYTRDSLDIESIIGSAETLKYSKEVKDWFAAEMENPSNDFIRLAMNSAYSGFKTQKMIEKFNPIVKKALQQYINDLLNSKIKSALNTENAAQAEDEADTDLQEDSSESSKDKKSGINTTLEELEAYSVVKAILHEVVDPARIFYRDTKSYFGILLDDTNRRWICRVNFDSSNKHLYIPDDDKNPVRYDINGVDDLFDYSDQIIESCNKYL